MEPLARVLIGVGLLLLAAGIVLWLIGWLLPGLALGRLPGDIRIERPGFTFYFPVTTGVLVSIVLSLLLYALSRLR